MEQFTQIKDHYYYMELCMGMAKNAAFIGNPAVGCIIVKEGELLRRQKKHL